MLESSGLIFALLDEIGNRMNFTYQVVTPPKDDQYFGAVQSNGEFNGVIGMVERGEAHLSAALLIVNEERSNAVNFTIPISLEPYALMFQRPQEMSRALLFIYPFQPLVRKSLCRNIPTYIPTYLYV